MHKLLIQWKDSKTFNNNRYHFYNFNAKFKFDMLNTKLNYNTKETLTILLCKFNLLLS